MDKSNSVLDVMHKVKFNRGVSIKEEGRESAEKAIELDVDTTME